MFRHMPVIQADSQGIQQAVEALQRGECIGFPTETVYGLAADGLNAQAAARIFEIKGRPAFDPLILHVDKSFDLTRIAHPTPLALKLIKAFWPGPLTVLVERKSVVPDLVTSGLPTVAIRSPDHPIAQEILAKVKTPLAAPSANRFGRISPTTPYAVEEELGNAVPVILDGGPCRIGIESTIVDCTGEAPIILRKGGFTAEQIKAVAGEVEYGKLKLFQAPGLLEHHYAPQTPLYRSDRLLVGLKEALPKEFSYLFWTQPEEKISLSKELFRVLTPANNTTEAAVHLFQFLRELDALKRPAILCDPVPLEGLGLAIDDRLYRSSRGTAHWNGKSFELKFR